MTTIVLDRRALRDLSKRFLFCYICFLNSQVLPSVVKLIEALRSLSSETVFVRKAMSQLPPRLDPRLFLASG